MKFPSVLRYAHQLIEERVHLGETVVDATVGNGNDTIFLRRCVGMEGTVYGFDVQEQALQHTSMRIVETFGADSGVRLFLQNHARMIDILPPSCHGKIAAVTLNLGYLPGGDHRMVTTPASTIPALDGALSLLRPNGVITIVVYSGHEGGQAEADSVSDWASQLPQTQYHVLQYQYINQRNQPPYLIAVMKGSC